MRPKKLDRKLVLNKRTVADLNIKDMLKIPGGADTVYGPTCKRDSCYPFCETVEKTCISCEVCVWLPGHTEEGHTCKHFFCTDADTLCVFCQ